MEYRALTFGALAAVCILCGCETTESGTAEKPTKIQSVAIEDLPKRAREVKLKGEWITLLGPKVVPEDRAPAFRAMDKEGKKVTLKQLRGDVLLISAVPSITTPVCKLQTFKFNLEAERLPKNVRVITISTDPIDTQNTYCSDESIDKIELLSDAKYQDFGKNYGILIDENKKLARSIWIITPYGEIAYREIVPELTGHPDYKTAIAAAKGLAQKRW